MSGEVSEPTNSCKTCKEIITCFTEYHTKIVETLSFQSQNPSHINIIQNTLRKTGPLIRKYIQKPYKTKDKQLQAFFTCLGDTNKWDSHCKTCPLHPDSPCSPS